MYVCFLPQGNPSMRVAAASANSTNKVRAMGREFILPSWWLNQPPLMKNMLVKNGWTFSPKVRGENSQKIFRVANFPVTYMDHLGTAPLYLPANLPDPNTSNLFWSLDKKLPLTLAEKAGVFLASRVLASMAFYVQYTLYPKRQATTDVT